MSNFLMWRNISSTWSIAFRLTCPSLTNLPPTVQESCKDSINSRLTIVWHYPFIGINGMFAPNLNDGERYQSTNSLGLINPNPMISTRTAHRAGRLDLSVTQMYIQVFHVLFLKCLGPLTQSNMMFDQTNHYVVYLVKSAIGSGSCLS